MRIILVLVPLALMGVFLYGVVWSPRIAVRTTDLDKRATSPKDRPIAPGVYAIIGEATDPESRPDAPRDATRLLFLGGDSFWGRPVGNEILVTQAPDAYLDLIGHRIKAQAQ